MANADINFEKGPLAG